MEKENLTNSLDLDSIFELGKGYIEGIDFDKDIERGIKLLEEAADKNHIEAQLYLSEIYFDGLEDIERDLVKATEYCMLGLELDSKRHIIQYARIKYFERDYPEAMKWMKKLMNR